MPSPTTFSSTSGSSRCARRWSRICSISFPREWKRRNRAEATTPGRRAAGAIRARSDREGLSMATKVMTAYDVNRIRADFPLLALEVRGKPLVYLDNAATTQKPRQVIDALTHY